MIAKQTFGILRATLTAGLALTGVNTNQVAAAEILDCAALQRIAPNPHSVSNSGNSGTGWQFSRGNPAVLGSDERVKKDGWDDRVTEEIQPGDMLQATIKLFDMRQDQRPKPNPKMSYFSRWVAPWDIKPADPNSARCTSEEPTTLEAGNNMLHTLDVTKFGLQDMSGTWHFIAYDSQRRILAHSRYELTKPRSKEAIASAPLEENFRLYMVLDKCLTLGAAPLSKEEYRDAISVIDKQAKQSGIDTEAAWKRTAAASQVQLDNWDQQIATATRLNGEARRILLSSCASYSGELIRAAREASGTRPTPKKDF